MEGDNSGDRASGVGKDNIQVRVVYEYMHNKLTLKGV